MRNYLFIDLHMHSTYSYETGCDATPSDILDNSITKAMQVKELMKEKIDEVVKNEPEKFNDLMREYCRYFGDTIEDQRAVYKEMIYSENPVELLKEYIDKRTKCCISITDHQNIKGSAEAIKIIKKNEDKYQMIEFIPGIEVNAGLRCVEKNKDNIYSAYRACHALAYGYDIKDKTLNAYSKLYHYTAGNWEIGKMVLFARKRIEDIYNIKIPLKKITGVIRGKPAAIQVMHRFYEYLAKKHPEVDINKIKCEDSDEPCFNFSQQGNINAISGSKWELDDYMLAIDHAGGKFSIAHPYTIRNKNIEQKQAYYNNEFIKELIKVTNVSDFKILQNEDLKVSPKKKENDSTSSKKSTKEIIKSAVKKINKKNNKNFFAEEIYQAYIDYMYGRNLKDFVDKVVNIRKSLPIKEESFGFEIFYKTNLSGAKSKILYDIASKYELFLTGGSDYHGNLSKKNRIGKCFDKDFIESTDKDLFEMENSELQKKINMALKCDFNNMLAYMPFIDFVKNNKIPENRQEIKFYNIPNGVMHFDSSLFDRHRTWTVDESSTPRILKKELSTKGIDHISRNTFGYIDNEIYFTKPLKEELKRGAKVSRQNLDYNIKLDNNKKVSTIKYNEGYCWGD